MNRLAKILMVGWTILCFMGSCSGIMNLSHGSQGKTLEGAEALGAGIGLLMWLIIWAVPMVVLGIVALVAKPSKLPAAAAFTGAAAILCPQCGKYHPVNVSFCPHCASPSDNQNAVYLPSDNSQPVSLQIRSDQPYVRTKRIVLSLLVIGVAIVVYRLFAPTTPDGTGVQDASQLPASGNGIEGESSNSLPITAGQLYREYQQNEVLADSKYKGKRLSVTGVVGGIRKGLFDEAVLDLVTTNQFESVSAYLNSSDNSAAAALSKGATVNVLCEGAGMTVGSPVLRKCHIETRKATPVPADTQDNSVEVSYPNITYPSSLRTIHAMDFSNTSYHIYKSDVQLNDGSFQESLGYGMVDVTKLRNVWFLRETQGDSEQALIYIDDDTGKQHVGFLLLFEVRDDHPVVTEEISFNMYADGTGVSAPSDSAGNFVIRSRRDDGTPECCPEYLDVVSFQRNGSLFRKTSARVEEIPRQ